MTTSCMYKCVSPDFVITTPEQIEQAFAMWQQRYLAEPETFGDSYDDTEYGKGSAGYFIGILQELNETKA